MKRWHGRLAHESHPPWRIPPVDFSVLGRAETALRLTGKMPVPLRKDFSYTL
jgi:hypothetical protein